MRRAARNAMPHAAVTCRRVMQSRSIRAVVSSNVLSNIPDSLFCLCYRLGLQNVLYTNTLSAVLVESELCLCPLKHDSKELWAYKH